MRPKGVFTRYPYLKQYFTFPSFNSMQEECVDTLLNTDESMVVSAPTSSGKTVLFELAIIRQCVFKDRFKTVYLAPIKSLCQQKLRDWKSKFSSLRILELTGDTSQSNPHTISQASIIIATPQKLDYLTRNTSLGFEINLLLIDEIHMINVQTRGAVLEAVVTRLQTKWKKLRIIGVSATISNIHDISQWLQVPEQNTKEFGESYRPVQVKKVVLGYRPSKNPYLFERSLNNKLFEIIIKNSEHKSSLVFCQTQKGTVAACEKLLQTLPRSYLITSDSQSNSLIKCSRKLADKALAKMVLSGVAYHNASLTLQDRNLVVEQFLGQHIKIICTTSTLAQGMNLPARLVIIKGTVAYRGAGKGYQEYTGTEIEQMMGRAGRLGFDTEGTAIIMTQNFNISKFNRQLVKQDLESNFGEQVKEYVNVEISLRNIRTFDDAMSYLKRTFYYIRMGECPQKYGISKAQQRQSYIKRICEQTIQELLCHELIYEGKGEINPLQLSVELSKSSVSFKTLKHILLTLPTIKNLESFITMLCESSQIDKFRSKLNERRCLKELNSMNRFKIKDTIGTAAKKAVILFQAFLSQFSIDQWELKRQAEEIAGIVKNVLYIIRHVLKRKKLFLPCCYCNSLIRYLNKGCWDYPEQMVVNNLHPLKERVDVLKLNKIDSMQKLNQSLTTQCLAALCHQPEAYNTYLLEYIQKYSEIWVSSEKKEQLEITIHHNIVFSSEIKSIKAIVASDEELELSTESKPHEKEIKVYLKKYRLPIRIYLILDNTLGFDKSFVMEVEGVWKQTVSFQNDQDAMQTSLRDYSNGKNKQGKNRQSPKKEVKRIKRKDSGEQEDPFSLEEGIQSLLTIQKPKPKRYESKLLRKTNRYQNIPVRKSHLNLSNQKPQKVDLYPVDEVEPIYREEERKYVRPCIIDEPIPLCSNFTEYSYSKYKEREESTSNQQRHLYKMEKREVEKKEVEKQKVRVQNKRQVVQNEDKKEDSQLKEGDWGQMFKRLAVSDRVFLKKPGNINEIYDEMYKNL